MSFCVLQRFYQKERSLRVPEEVNRRIVDQIADINLVYSDLAREHPIREGFPSDRVIKTGSPMY